MTEHFALSFRGWMHAARRYRVKTSMASLNPPRRHPRATRDSLVGFSRLQILPCCGMEIVRAAKIRVDIVSVVTASRNVRDLPVPGPIVFDLPEPDQPQLRVFGHCHRQIALCGPTAHTARSRLRPTRTFVLDKTHL